MPNYYGSVIGSVFKFDSNGYLEINVMDSIGYDSLLTSFRTHSTGDEVYDRTVSVTNLIASGMEYA